MGTWDSVNNQKWSNFNFPNNLYGQFLPYQNILSQDQRVKDSKNHDLIPQNPIISAMFDIPDLGVLILGSTNGEIYLVRTESVFCEPEFVLGTSSL